VIQPFGIKQPIGRPKKRLQDNGMSGCAYDFVTHHISQQVYTKAVPEFGDFLEAK
jgi:hypothetical protein